MKFRSLSFHDIIVRGIRHVFAGGIGTLLYVLCVIIFTDIFHLHPVISVSISFLLLIIYTYLVNNYWVYESTKNHRYKIPRFLSVVIMAYTLNVSIMYIAYDTLHLHYYYGLIITAIIVPPTNFLLNYYWAFK